MRRIGIHGAGFVPISNMGACPSGGAATPYSLYYDGSDDETDCGVGASIVGLNLADMTLDVYWKCPAALGAWSWMCLASQGIIRGGGNEGWALYITVNGAAQFSPWFFFSRFGVAVGDVQTPFQAIDGAWHYIRCRITGAATPYNVLISIDAGAEASVGSFWVGVLSAEHLWHGRHGGAGHEHGKGNLCYVHVWNTNKGALVAVPTTPFPIDANTAGRWIHSEGAGVALGDTSGNANNGAISGATWSPTIPAGWTI